MAFDLATAKPVGENPNTGFDLATAKPVDNSPVPQDNASHVGNDLVNAMPDISRAFTHTLLAPAGKTLSLAMGSLIKPIDLAFGTSLQDRWFGATTAAFDRISQMTEQRPDAGITGKVMSQVGSLGGMVMGMELTAPAKIASMAPAAAELWPTISAMITHGAGASAGISLSSAIDTGSKVFNETNDGLAAFNAAKAAYLTTTGITLFPLNAGGGAVQRAATSFTTGLATTEAAREYQNANMPSDMQSPFTFEDALLNGLMMAGLGVIGPRGNPGMAKARDINNAATVVGEGQNTDTIAGRVAQVFKKTGITPGQIVADSMRDPTIAEDLKAPTAEPAQTVHESILTQLNAIGRFSPEENQAYATLAAAKYAVDAKDLGITPEEMLQRHPLNIAGEKVGGPPPPDQRSDLAHRAAIDQMSEADKTAAILKLREDYTKVQLEKRTSPLTGLPNKLAYDEAPKLAVQAFADIDGLKVINDTYGHEAGDVFIKAMADALKHETDQAFHRSGDEFYVQGHTEEAVRAVMDRARQSMTERGFEYTLPDGTVAVKKGVGFSYGTGKDIKAAEDAQYVDKAARESLGLRAGRKPGGLGETPATGGQVQGDTSGQTKGQETGGVGGETLFQRNQRGAYTPSSNTITLLKNADPSTFLHELGHHFLEMTADLAGQSDAPGRISADFNTLLEWFGVNDKTAWDALSFDAKRAYHEQFARGFESYLRDGRAPSIPLEGVFAKFRAWLVEVYKSATQLGAELTPEVRAVMDRMLATQEQIDAAKPLTDSVVAKTMEQRIQDPAMRQELTDMRAQTGWSEQGGRIIRDMGGDVVGRTHWIPNYDWWPGRPDGMNSRSTVGAIDKALAGEKLNAAEKRMVSYLLDVADEHRKSSDFSPTPEELTAGGLQPQDELGVSMVARAASIDDAMVERLATQYGEDDTAFMGKIKEFLNEHDQNAKAAGPGQENQPAPFTDPSYAQSGIPRAYHAIAREIAVKSALQGTEHDLNISKVLENTQGTITSEKAPNHINYAYVDSPEEVKAVHARISEVFEKQIAAVRGKESWGATQAKAQEILTNQGLRATIGNFESLAAKGMAWEAMAQKAAFDVAEAARTIRAKGAEVTPEDIKAQISAIETLAFLQAVDQGNGAEIARALNARKAAKQMSDIAKATSNLFAQYGHDPQELAGMIGELNSKEGLAKFAQGASKATWWEKVIEAWKAGLVSGPVTHLANIMGNTTFAALRVPVDALAGTIGMLRGADVGERLSLFEPLARVAGILEGTKNGLKIGAAMMAKEDTMVGKAESFRHAIEGKKGEIIRLPFRALGAEDAVFKAMNESGETFSVASRQAITEGLNPQTREFRERIVQLMQNPTPDMVKAIFEAGQRFTFNAELGDKGQAVQTFVRKWHLEFMVPFIRTPGNIAKELLRMTPLAPVIGEWRADLMAGGIRRDRAMAEIMLGTGVMATVFAQALNGTISGQGDPDPAKRRSMLAAGWQPYSIRLGNTWYNYQRLQPLGTLVGMAADTAEVWDHMDPHESDKTPKMLSIAFANAITNQTFLQGITNLVNAMSDPGRFGPRMVQQFAASGVPNIVAQPTSMLDPYVREVNSVRDAVTARIPGLRQGLLPRLDIFGDPLQTKERLGAVSPVTETTVSTDKVRTEAARLGVGVANAPKNIELPAMHQMDIGKVQLTPEQQNKFTEMSGKMAHQILDPIVNQPAWDNMPDLVKKSVYDKVFAQTRKLAQEQVIPPDQRAAEMQRIADEIMARMKIGGQK